MILYIITPEKIVLKEEIEEVVVPTVNGEIAILPNHVPLITQIATGELIIKRSGKPYSVAIAGGFLEIQKDEVNILANFAIRAEDIEVAKAQEAQQRAEKLMKEKTTDRDFKIAEAEMIKSVLQLQVATKYKRRRPL